jgi:uncharacterized membrane protein YjfL (UPF0719 family)
MDNLNEILTQMAHAGVYLACAFVIFFIGRLLYQVFSPKIDVKSELVEKDNFAFSVSYVGYFVGLLLAIGSAIVGPSVDLLTDVEDIFIYGLLAVVLLNLSRIINDKLILTKFSSRKEIIVDHNTGTGVIEAANSIASGLIIYGAISGDTGGEMSGILSAVIFWAIGQVLLIVTAKVYNLITAYDVHDYIEKDNVAVGIGFAGAMIALGNIIHFGISDDFESWDITALRLGTEVLLGLVMLPIVRFLADKILLPGRRLTDELINQEKPNNGAALIEAFSYIGGSVLILWCI